MKGQPTRLGISISFVFLFFRERVVGPFSFEGGTCFSLPFDSEGTGEGSRWNGGDGGKFGMPYSRGEVQALTVLTEWLLLYAGVVREGTGGCGE